MYWCTTFSVNVTISSLALFHFRYVPTFRTCVKSVRIVRYAEFLCVCVFMIHVTCYILSKIEQQWKCLFPHDIRFIFRPLLLLTSWRKRVHKIQFQRALYFNTKPFDRTENLCAILEHVLHFSDLFRMTTQILIKF